MNLFVIEFYSRIRNHGFPHVYLNSSSGALQTCQWRDRDSCRVIPEQTDGIESHPMLWLSTRSFLTRPSQLHMRTDINTASGKTQYIVDWTT